MALEKFSLELLSKMDEGRHAEMFAQLLRELEADCRNRPNVDAARTLSLTVTLVPIIDEAKGDLGGVALQFQMTSKTPDRRSRVYHALAKPGGLFVNELSPNDARQGTLDNAAGPRPITDAG